MLWFKRKRKLSNLSGIIRQLIEQQRQIMADLTALNTAIAANKAAIDAVTTEVTALKAAAVNDQPAVDAATQALAANTAALEALVPAPAAAPAV